MLKEAAIATFESPWAVKLLPDKSFLVSQRSSSGKLFVVSPAGVKIEVSGLPKNIGVLDILLAPDFAKTGTIYLSYMEQDPTAPRVGRAKDDAAFEPQRMSAARAQLKLSAGAAEVVDVKVIFNQVPWIVAYAGSGEPGGRMAFSPDGKYLFLTSGDRQELGVDPLFKLDNNIGKIVRLFPDGTIPTDNPFVGTAGARPEIWTFGHRNPYGLAFAPDGVLWSTEMGPMGGDEINLIRPGLNYG